MRYASLLSVASREGISGVDGKDVSDGSRRKDVSDGNSSFPRNTQNRQSRHFCTASNGNKLEIVES